MLEEIDYKFKDTKVDLSKAEQFSDEFRKKIPGTENSAKFWAAGISIVAHMKLSLIHISEPTRPY